MPSTFIKVLLAFTSISPALLILYIDRICREFKHLSIYIKAGSFQDIKSGLVNFLTVHYLLLLFLGFVLLAGWIIGYMKAKGTRGRITAKSIKAADYNFISIVTSFIPFIIKFIKPEIDDWQLLLLFLVMGMLLAVVFNTAYHFNLILRYLFSYKHYEVTTKGDVTYITLSKKKLINPKDITEYFQVADHMIVNIS